MSQPEIRWQVTITYLSVRFVCGWVEFSGRRVVLLKRQVLDQCNAVDVIEDSHQQLKENIFIHFSVHDFVEFSLTNWMIPQTEMIKPHSESFGPQIGIFLALLVHVKLLKFGDFQNFPLLRTEEKLSHDQPVVAAQSRRRQSKRQKQTNSELERVKASVVGILSVVVTQSKHSPHCDASTCLGRQQLS